MSRMQRNKGKAVARDALAGGNAPCTDFPPPERT